MENTSSSAPDGIHAPRLPLTPETVAEFGAIELPSFGTPVTLRTVTDTQSSTIYQLSFTLPAAEAEAWAKRYSSVFGAKHPETAKERRIAFGITALSVKPEQGGSSARPNYYHIGREIFLTYPNEAQARVYVAIDRTPR
jgi:hypothetical protein